MASLNTFQGTLGHRRAAHLLRRASFRYTKNKVDQLAAMTADEAVNVLVASQPLEMDQPIYDSTATPTVEYINWINPPGQTLPDSDFNLHRRILGWWLNEALNDEGIGHKMEFFFHQYMAVTNFTSSNTVFFDYLALLRWGSLGNFKSLATKMIADNTMLRYLNNNANTKTNPNENFAREFLELFTIGKGPQIAPGDYTNYTEDDIIQAAKVLTGLVTKTDRSFVDSQTGIPSGVISFSRHALGSKTFSSKFQNTVIQGATNAAGYWTEINAFVTMVFNQDETARNFCRRLYRYFLHREITPEVETDIIVPLATFFKNGNFEVAPVLRKLLRSEHFFDADDSDNKDEIMGGMIKSPLELTLQALSFYNITIPNPITQNNTHYNTFWVSAVVDRLLAYANLPLFYPPDVAGYPAYHQFPDYSRQWFGGNTVIARYKLPEILLTGKRVLGGSPTANIGIKLDIVPWVRNSGVCTDPADPYVLVKDLLDYLLPEEPDNERFEYFYNTIFLDGLPPADWTYEWQNYISTNNQTEVKIALERLIKYIMFSPEYQTF
jgi:uncharacterized protein (DUF1800 family)